MQEKTLASLPAVSVSSSLAAHLRIGNAVFLNPKPPALYQNLNVHL